MRHALAVLLLFAAVVGAVARPRRIPAWLAPVVAAVVSVVCGTVSLHLAQAKCRLFPDRDPLAIYQEYGISDSYYG